MAVGAKAIKQAIFDYKGNVTRVAQSFDLSRGAIYNRINKSDTLKRALKESRDMRNDSVRDVLYEAAVNDRNIVAAIFIAKTQMGWKETSVNETHVSGEIAHKGYVGVSPDDWSDDSSANG